MNLSLSPPPPPPCPTPPSPLIRSTLLLRLLICNWIRNFPFSSLWATLTFVQDHDCDNRRHSGRYVDVR